MDRLPKFGGFWLEDISDNHSFLFHFGVFDREKILLCSNIIDEVYNNINAVLRKVPFYIWLNEVCDWVVFACPKNYDETQTTYLLKFIDKVNATEENLNREIASSLRGGIQPNQPTQGSQKASKHSRNSTNGMRTKESSRRT